ncbi:hypothetical protein [Acinetobacter oleivorans]|uniref:hypothetical protein n=1 Tax=Acinetobacter oleivorans TaxID=1148157 RepID=UPI0012505D78|nr:hypothetical protein [Acinetobacter oleivorans]
MEKFIFNKIGEYKSDWAITYVDPNNTYSAGGGRLTVVLSSYSGSAFFSHVGQPTFKEFVAQCDAPYLLKKLFPNLKKWVNVEDGEEVIEYIATNKLSELKESRSSGEIAKKDLRKFYEHLKEIEFESISNLFDQLTFKDRTIMSELFGEDWLWESGPTKINSVYTYLEIILEDVISEFKKMIGDAA